MNLRVIEMEWTEWPSNSLDMKFYVVAAVASFVGNPVCKNILNISRECNVERLFLNMFYVKSAMKYADSPDNAWPIDTTIKRVAFGAIQSFT